MCKTIKKSATGDFLDHFCLLNWITISWSCFVWEGFKGWWGFLEKNQRLTLNKKLLKKAKMKSVGG